MARSAPLLPDHTKRPSRASLGIPDGRDVLAVYFWWMRQRCFCARYHRGDAHSETASSARSTTGDWDPRAASLALLPPPTPAQRATFEEAVASFDLMGVGGQFE